MQFIVMLSAGLIAILLFLGMFNLPRALAAVLVLWSVCLLVAGGMIFVTLRSSDPVAWMMGLMFGLPVLLGGTAILTPLVALASGAKEEASPNSPARQVEAAYQGLPEEDKTKVRSAAKKVAMFVGGLLLDHLASRAHENKNYRVGRALNRASERLMGH